MQKPTGESTTRLSAGLHFLEPIHLELSAFRRLHRLLDSRLHQVGAAGVLSGCAFLNRLGWFVSGMLDFSGHIAVEVAHYSLDGCAWTSGFAKSDIRHGWPDTAWLGRLNPHVGCGSELPLLLSSGGAFLQTEGVQFLGVFVRRRFPGLRVRSPGR